MQGSLRGHVLADGLLKGTKGGVLVTVSPSSGRKRFVPKEGSPLSVHG